MPVLIAIVTILAGAAFWYFRLRNTATAAREIADFADDALTTVLNAPRRIRFRRQTGMHPVEGVDDPRLAIAAIAQAFLELDALPTQEQRTLLEMKLRSVLKADPEEAREMEIVGRWLMTECNGPRPAIARLTRRLYKIDGAKSQDALFEILGAITPQDGLSPEQENAVSDIRAGLRLKQTG